MLMKLNRVFLLLVVLSAQFPSFAQDPTKTLGKVNIASPNAASLGKYGDIPVSYHTGVPNINIPLYTVSYGPLKLPINLSYHASGLKVEENDSWVGAGWTLNAGGAIIRTVKDKPDEKQTSSLSQTYGHYSDYGYASYWANAQPYDETNIDNEPDLFYFNFNGYSGKFYFNDDRTPVLVPEQDIKIQCSYTPGTWNNSPGAWSGNGRCIESFTLITPDGVKYFFGIAPTPAQNPYCDPIEVASMYTANMGTSYSQAISSWFLYQIVSPDGSFSINLNYQRDKYAFYTFTNPPTFTLDQANNSAARYALVKNLMAGVLLSQITTPNETVNFVPGSVRQDLSRWASGIDQSLTDNINQSSPTLGSISVSDNQSNCFKKFSFSYDYFTDSTTAPVFYFSGIISDKKRLKLLAVQEQSCDATVSKPPYQFDYFSEQVPRKLSFSRDHWGYNNGVTANSQLYPALSNNTGVVNSSLSISIANRESAWPAMRGGALRKITYPTGGNTVFDFEANTFTVNSVVNGQVVPTDQIVGGLRIKTITNYDPINNQTNVTNYSYLSQSNNLSSGVLYSRPIYYQLFRNDWAKKSNFLGQAPNTQGCFDTFSPTDTTQTRGSIYSDNPIRPMETTQGYHIGYGEVKVSQTGNGFSIYRFSVTPPWQINRDNVAVTKVNNPGSCDPSIPNYPAAPLPTDFSRGEPTYEGHFTQDGSVLSEKLFNAVYTLNPVTTPGRLNFVFTAAGNNRYGFATFYELQTARKSQTTVTEQNYQLGGGMLQTQVQTYYESNYHHEPTRIVTTNSKSQTVEKRMKYAFDFRVPIFDTVSNCYTGAAKFLNYSDSLFYTGGYSSQFNSCPGYTSSCYSTTSTNYSTALFNARVNYINCRKANFTNTSPLNTYQVNHNTAKSAADTLLKPILWMQDNYMDPVIETSTWTNSQLTAANFYYYNNKRDDNLGVYFSTAQKIDLQAPSATFTASSVSATNTSVSTDSRYALETLVESNQGKIINSLSRDGVSSGYDWGYNSSLPIVKTLNAANHIKETLLPGTVNTSFNFPIGGSTTTYGGQYAFNQTQAGPITLTMPSLPSGANVTVSYTLTGPSGQSGYLCNSGSGGTSCGTTPSTITYNNMPTGQYTLNYTVSTSFSSFTFNYSLSFTYQGMSIVMAGSKAYFAENFEENLSAITGTAHTGNKYYNGNYTCSFAPPDSRNYIIQWWNLISGKWIFNQQNYAANMTLTGPVDDIRIFPVDAQIITYTYKPLIGITSQTDPSGKTIYYEYDGLGRLKDIKNQDGNIIKVYNYRYQGQ
ncbi:YD repeat-containing protein [Sediminibacterium magnilacihabitans]|jgi:YD repeat-containing protein|nr:YD repeat-containing protein [Sediminibacterium magnilacihabitans]